MLYNVLSVGKKTPKTARSRWDFVTLPEEDLAMTIGNMHKKDHTRGSGESSRQTHGQIHTDTQTCLSQYFATAASGELNTENVCDVQLERQ